MMTLVTLSSSVLEMVNKMIKKMIKKMVKKMIMEMIKMIKMIKMVKVVEVVRIMMIEGMHTLLKAGGVKMEHQGFTRPVHLIITF